MKVGGKNVFLGELGQQRDCLLSPEASRGHYCQIRLLGSVSTWVFKPSKNGDYTTLLANLYLGFFSLYIWSEILFFSLRHFAFIPYHALL